MMINREKIHSALLAQLAKSRDPNEREFSVFITINGALSAEQFGELSDLGADHVATGVYSATLSKSEIEDLSGQPWVKTLHADVQFQTFRAE